MKKRKPYLTGQQLLIKTLKEYAKNPPIKDKRRSEIERLMNAYKLS